MEKINSVYSLLASRALPLVGIAVFTATACQVDAPRRDLPTRDSASRSSCGALPEKSVDQAVRRVAGISDSIKIDRLGHPGDAVADLIAQYDAGTAKQVDYRSFCSFYRESVDVNPSVAVKFSLVEELPDVDGRNKIGKRYRMAKAAVATEKKGVLYFECSSDKLNLGAGATVLVRGESRTNDDVAEPERAAHEDNLHIVYESSRVFAELLGCKANAGLPSTFTMPPEL